MLLKNYFPNLLLVVSMTNNFTMSMLL